MSGSGGLRVAEREQGAWCEVGDAQRRRWQAWSCYGWDCHGNDLDKEISRAVISIVTIICTNCYTAAWEPRADLSCSGHS